VRLPTPAAPVPCPPPRSQQLQLVLTAEQAGAVAKGVYQLQLLVTDFLGVSAVAYYEFEVADPEAAPLLSLPGEPGRGHGLLSVCDP
jgi:hypothetical protein